MFKLCKSATTNDEDERLFENPEDEAKFDKLIEEAFRLYIEEEWEKEKSCPRMGWKSGSNTAFNYSYSCDFPVFCYGYACIWTI